MANTKITQLPTVALSPNTWFEISESGISGKANVYQLQVISNIVPAFTQVNVAGQTLLTATPSANTLFLNPTGGLTIKTNGATQQVTLNTQAVFDQANVASLAFGQANLAFTHGDQAGVQANTARDRANQAFGIVIVAGQASLAANATRPDVTIVSTGGIAVTTNANTNILTLDTTQIYAKANLGMSSTGGTFTGDLNVSANLSIAGNLTLGQITIVRGLVENTSLQISAVPANLNVDLYLTSVYYYTANMSQNITVNYRGNSTIRLNDAIANGQSFTSTMILRNGSGVSNTYIPGTWQIDGVGVTPRFAGGANVAVGHANSVDMYTATVIKTDANTFGIFVGQVFYN